MSRFTSRAALAVIMAFAAGACFAQADKPAPLTGEAAAIKKSLETKFPGAEVRSVTKTQYFGGLYEVLLDDRILYTDGKAKFLLIGAMYDSEAKVNLTEERQRKLNRVNVAADTKSSETVAPPAEPPGCCSACMRRYRFSCSS